MPPIQLFSALADQTRCTIIEMLLAQPMPVHRLAEAFAISRPAISRHLRVLGEAGLVIERKQGRENIYAVQIEKLQAGIAWLERLSPAQMVITAPEQPEPVLPEMLKPARSKAPPPSTRQMAFDL
jgi:DNA-binding transcriptional ArsR family regulator